MQVLAAQHAGDAGGQLLGAERLRQVVVGAEAEALRLSSAESSAVRKMNGVSASRGLARRRATSVQPLMPGIMTSEMTRSGGSAMALASATVPSLAVVSVYSWPRSAATTTR
ncbi:hypothetical protein OV079_53235 [Nannocystis pusilla]|uniref:Uncharacterized protein n=1 Tax=Nannocystis pusilla TaxID=889268 RepID=A0A9X3J4B8_9BACT|nr:hypothetical protein [Nannocystis pusilla]MCY1014140.1 hypothetical protein [Nannocystis pusilla]